MGKKVLIVDDSAFMRNMLKDILSKGGYEIVGEAENGRMGAEMYRKLQPDLKTSDLIMPEMNGIEALKDIIATHPQAKIVMVSAMGQQALVDEALAAGAKTFIVKPFQAEEVLKVVKSVLG